MKWEYLVLEHAEEYWRTHAPEGGRYPHGLRIVDALTGKSPQEVLNIKGDEGWELVQVWERDQSVTKAFCEYSVFWFKRPAPKTLDPYSKNRPKVVAKLKGLLEDKKDQDG